MAEPTIRIGVSSCLLGEQVRFDGGHKRDRYLTDTLSRHFEWVTVCPEVEFGLGVPRETIRLVQIGERRTLQTSKTERDLTSKFQRFASRRVAQIRKEEVDGYILKKDSPSCGMTRVKVHSPAGPTKRQGAGMFAEELMRQCPNLPVEEEGRLNDLKLRENWVERVFAHAALRLLWKPRWTVGQLVAFHTRYKFSLLAHDESGYRRLGRLVANAKSLPRLQLREEYSNQFMTSLKRMATVRKNVNVLQHMLGYFSKQLDPASRKEVTSHIEDYRSGLVPLIVPLTLVRHYVRLLQVDYLQEQVYLNPHPKELALRNHV